MTDTSKEAVEALAQASWSNPMAQRYVVPQTLRALAAERVALTSDFDEYRELNRSERVALRTKLKAVEKERDEMQRRRDSWRKKAEGYDAVRLALREKVGTPWPPKMSRILWAGIAADEKKRADDLQAKLDEAVAALECVAEVSHHPVELIAIARSALALAQGDKTDGTD